MMQPGMQPGMMNQASMNSWGQPQMMQGGMQQPGMQGARTGPSGYVMGSGMLGT